MDTVAIIFKALELVPRLLPKPKPPVIDYMTLAKDLPTYEFPKIKETEIIVKTKPEPVVELETPAMEVEPEQPGVGTACLSCSRSHLSTVSGALNEALRFAREGGIADRECQRRIMMAEDEINIMERIDLSAESISKSPESEQKVAHAYLPKVRGLRQAIGNIASVEQLEKTAAEASILGQEFRLATLQAKGVDLNPVVELAKKVQAGEMTMAEAKAKLKELLPDER